MSMVLSASKTSCAYTAWYFGYDNAGTFVMLYIKDGNDCAATLVCHSNHSVLLVSRHLPRG